MQNTESLNGDSLSALNNGLSKRKVKSMLVSVIAHGSLVPHEHGSPTVFVIVLGIAIVLTLLAAIQARKG